MPGPSSLTTNAKKTKSGSSGEEEDKEIFTLRVSTSLFRYTDGWSPCSSPFRWRGFLLQVQGRERYEMLKKINAGLEMFDNG